MNKIGIYYAYWTKNWDADFVPYIAKVKRLGFDILEVNAGTVAGGQPLAHIVPEIGGDELTVFVALRRASKVHHDSGQGAGRERSVPPPQQCGH